MMKILFYISSLNKGGAERVISNLASLFSKKDYEVLFVTSTKSDNEYTLGENVKRIAISNEYIKSYLKRNIFNCRKLRKIMKEFKPDVAISFLAEPCYRLMLSSFGLKIKRILSVRGNPEKEERRNFISKLLTKMLYRRADYIVFQTKQQMEHFDKRIQKKGVIIQNPVLSTFYNVDMSNAQEKDIVSCGRLNIAKNFPLLIKAFYLIHNKVNENLYIYGEGALRDELQALIDSLGLQERVFLPGIIDDVPQTIKHAKLFVMSSDYEGLPNALMEAMVLGLPCISTDCKVGGPKDLLSDECGVLVPTNNVEMLSAAMLDLLQNKAKRELYGKNAKIKALNYHPDLIFKKWEELIKSLKEEL